jgi:ligand-binding sensor domain-containing protein
MRRQSVLILIFLIKISFSCAQQVDEKNFTRYTKLDGLSNNSVLSITQDSIGYLWIGTNKGLNRFDGQSFINIFKNQKDSPLPENVVVGLQMEDHNELMGVTNGGSFSMNTVTRKNKHFVIPADSVIFFWTNQVWQMVKNKYGQYIISTKIGLYVFDSSGKIICRYDNYSPADAGRIELWFGGWIETLSNNETFQITHFFGSVYKPADNRIDTSYSKKANTLKQALTGPAGQLNFCYPGRHDECFIIGLPDHSINSYNLITNNCTKSLLSLAVMNDLNWSSKLYFLSDSVMAITARQTGFYLLHYDLASKKIVCDERKYFSSMPCNTVFRDKEQRLWVGTNDGLFRQNLRNSFFSADDLSVQFPGIINANIKSVYTDKDQIVIGLKNNTGILLVEKKTKKLLQYLNTEELGPGCGTINFIYSYDPDTLWLGTGNGILWLNKKNHRFGKFTAATQSTGLLNNWFTNYFEDSHGNIWLNCGGLNNVTIYKKGERRFELLSAATNPLFKITFCFSISEDKQGNIWLAGDGLCRWNAGKKCIDLLIPYPKVSSAIFNYMQILDRDEDNNLWLASYDNEIIQFNCTTRQMFLRLPANSMVDGYTVTNSPIINNCIWMGMKNGISAFNIKDHSIRQFNYSDGLPSAMATTIRKASFYDQYDNRFYFGAGIYLISFIPDVSLSPDFLPTSFLELTDNSGNILPVKKGAIHLHYSRNDVMARLNAINFTDPEENRFAYKLADEADSNWHEIYTQNSIALTNLSPGSHNFEIKLFSMNNRWPPQLRSVMVIVDPPFWNTAWFISIASLIIFGSFYIIYLLRIRNIRQRANVDRQLAELEMKGLHAQMNPHFIFNSLNSIKEMILEDERQNASRYLSKFAQLVRTNLEQSKHTFIPVKECIDHLQQYLEMEKIRFADFAYTITLNDNIATDEILMAPMLIQPFVENAIWHGLQKKQGEKKIVIRFYRAGSHLICEIDDNGIGINESQKNKSSLRPAHHSLGIENIQERLTVLNEKYRMSCSLTIKDKSELSGAETKGTLVILKLNI